MLFKIKRFTDFDKSQSYGLFSIYCNQCRPDICKEYLRLIHFLQLDNLAAFLPSDMWDFCQVIPRANGSERWNQSQGSLKPSGLMISQQACLSSLWLLSTLSLQGTSLLPPPRRSSMNRLQRRVSLFFSHPSLLGTKGIASRRPPGVQTGSIWAATGSNAAPTLLPHRRTALFVRR